MQRKAIRATVGGSDVDIPIHTFLPNQFVYFDGSGTGALTTAVAVTPVGTPVAGNVAEWFSATSIVDSGISLANVVTTTATPTAAQVAVFTGVGKAIAPATVTIVGGAISNVTAIDGVDPLTWVVGPASAVNNNLASFNGTTGKVIKDSGTALANVVTSTSTPSANQVSVFTGTGVAIKNTTVSIDSSGNITGVTTINGTAPGSFVVGPTVAVDGDVAVFNGTTGKVVKDTGLISTNIITTAAAAPSTNTVPVFSGTGKNINPSTVTITGGAVASVTTINSIDPATWVVGPASAVNANLASYSGTTGKLIQDAGVATANLVTSASTPVANRITTWTGGGKNIQNSGVSITGTDVTGVTSLNAKAIGLYVTGPGSTPSAGAVATFTGTGDEIQDTLVTISGSTVSGVVTLSGVTVANVVTTTATPTAGLVPVFTGTGKAVAPSAVTLTGGAFTGVTGIDGVDITAHISRHTVGGADSMFALTWGTNKADTPAYVGSGTFYPRFIYASIESAQTLNTSVTGVSTPVAIPRNGRYVCRFVFFVTSDGSAGTLTGYATWGAGVGLALFNIAPGIAGGVVTTSGGSTAMSIPSGKSAWIIYVDLTVYNAVASNTIYIQFSWSSTPASLSDGGSTTVIEYSS